MSGISYAVQFVAFADCIWHSPEWRILVRGKSSLVECKESIERIVAPTLGSTAGNPDHYRAVKLNKNGKVIATYPTNELLAGAIVESHVYKNADLVAA